MEVRAKAHIRFTKTSKVLVKSKNTTELRKLPKYIIYLTNETDSSKVNNSGLRKIGNGFRRQTETNRI